MKDLTNAELLARLLPALVSADRNISTAINIEDQKQVIVMYRDARIKRIMTSGDGMHFLYEVLKGLVGE